jgi:hypothetical protein
MIPSLLTSSQQGFPVARICRARFFTRCPVIDLFYPLIRVIPGPTVVRCEEPLKYQRTPAEVKRAEAKARDQRERMRRRRAAARGVHVAS